MPAIWFSSSVDDLLQRAVARGRVVQFAGMGLGVVHQFLHRFDRQAGPHHQTTCGADSTLAIGVKALIGIPARLGSISGVMTW